MYQLDVMNEINKQTDVRFYGRGFENYNTTDTINDIINKLSFHPDVIITGHSWLDDSPGQNVDPQPNLKINQTKIPKYFILNKEYVNLKEKINYFKENRFIKGFSHHHNVHNLVDCQGLIIEFWPFAFDANKFFYKKKNKIIDLGFSGILKNYSKNANQSDIRIKIMKKIHYSVMEVPLYKKKRYKNLNIFWNSFSTQKWSKYWIDQLNKRVWLSSEEYIKLIQQTKAFINTPSPLGLISPRYFECMAAGAVVFCEDELQSKNLFPEEILYTFKSDLSDFDARLTCLINSENYHEEICDKANKFVNGYHTWEIRIKQLISEMSQA